MQVTLIKPTLGRLEDRPFVDEARMEPLQLGVLGGLTPPGVDLRLFDDRIDEIDYDERTDLVAITVEAFTARRAYEIAAEFRARRVPVIMGGMHATLLPEEVAEHADSVFTGDAETLWAQVIADSHEGHLRPRYDASVGRPQGGTLPRRDLFAGKGYLPITLLQFGRGCRYRCDFCAVGAYFDHHDFSRSPDEVVAEIRSQPRRNLFFVDDNLIADHDAAKRLLRALVPLRVRWVSQASIDQVRDPELISARVSWLAATLPSLLVLSLGVWRFLEWLRVAAGLTAIVIAVVTIPMYRTALREGAVRDPGWSLGRWGSPTMLAVIFLATVLMAIGAASGV